MALYHKHRPQTFKDVVGQEHIVKTITNQISKGSVAHAYLFSGPRGVGKTTTARLLAKAINCPKRAENKIEPCDACDSCQEISESRSIDVIEIDAASHTGVDNVRESIIENAQFRPTRSKYKVFIVDEAHMLSTSAFNALLKTLEEPPEYVIFILATTELHKLPETIISRCQRFDFKKVGFDTMKKHLENIAKEEKIKIDKEVVERIINKSDGCVRDGISLLDQIMATGEKEITSEIASLVLPTSNIEEILKFASFLIHREAGKALEQLNKLAESGISLPQFIQDVIELFRFMMVTKSSLQAHSLGLDLSEKTKKEVLKLNKEITSLELIKLIDLMMKRRSEIKSSPIPQLPIELAVIEWGEGRSAGNKEIGDKNDDEDLHSGESGEMRDKKIGDKNDDEKVENKKTIKERVKKLVNKDAKFTLKEIKEKWDVFLNKIEADSPSLSFIIKSANLVDMSGNTLQISVGFKFHMEKLMEKTCQKKIESLLSEAINGNIKINVAVDKDAVEKEEQKNNELQDLTAIFGGEVVN